MREIGVHLENELGSFVDRALEALGTGSTIAARARAAHQMEIREAGAQSAAV